MNFLILSHMKINQKKFLQEIDTKKYQIFICSSPISLPLLGFVHTYIISNCKGKITRWDVWRTKNRVDSSDGYKNTYKPWTGLSIFYGNDLSEARKRWPTSIVGSITGGDDSLAHTMCEFIDRNESLYPLKNTYQFFGPNSNTFVQWFLDQFSDVNIELLTKAVGKRYLYNKDLDYQNNVNIAT